MIKKGQIKQNSKKLLMSVGFSVILLLTIVPTKSDAAFIAFTGGELGGTGEMNATITGTASFSTTTTRTGAYSFRTNPTAATGYVALGSYDAVGTRTGVNRTARTYYSAYIRFATLPNSNQTVASVTDGSNNYVARVLVSNTGVLTCSGATTSSTVATLVTGIWYRIDLDLTSNASSGCQINGGTQQTFTAANFTQNWWGMGEFLGSSTYDMYSDDLNINTSGFIGDYQVNVLKPDNTGSSSTWTNGAGTSPSNLADIPYDNDTSYITTSTNGAVSTVNLQSADTGGVDGRIFSVKSFGGVRDTGSVSGVSLRLKSGGSTSDTTSSDPGSGYVSRNKMLDNDPATGTTWTRAALDSIEVGFINNAAVAMRATAAYATVLSGPSTLPTVTTPTASSITTTTASIGGNPTSEGNSAISGRGACYALNQFTSWTNSASGSTDAGADMSSNGFYGISASGGTVHRLTDYGTTISDYNPGQTVRDVAISSTGQYQSFITSSNVAWYSNNFGSSFTASATNLTSYTLKSISQSNSGQYVLISAKSGSGAHYTFRSTDYGVTYGSAIQMDSTTNASYSTNDVAISGDGQYAVGVIINPGGVTYAGNTYVSPNGGASSWTSQAYPASPIGFYNAVSISKTGQYMMAASSRSSSSYDFIAVSTDYGASWNSVGNAKFNDVAISSSGMYGIAAATSGLLYYTNDYGQNWTSTESSRSWGEVGISQDGKYMLAGGSGVSGAYISSDYGRGSSTCVSTSGTTGAFTVGATGLTPDTLYYYLAYADNFMGRGTTTITSFTTAASTPIIGSPTSASITGSGATLGGNITNQGGSAVTARGVCYALTATNVNPQSGGSGVTCVAEGSGGTGVFTKAVTGLTQNSGYSYTAYATNTQGTAYTSAATFSTPNVNPTGVDTNSPTGVNSYYVTLSGVANPNSAASTGHFRVYTTTPGNCNSDSLGIRYPQSSGNDVVIGADSSPHTFTYTIPPNANTFLEPNTQYWYCSFAINTNGTTGGATVATFTTGDGPSSPCDPPASGNLTIPATATCNLNGNFNGVDTGSGTTNTGSLILSTTAQMTIGPSQQVAFGSFQLQKPNSSLVIARGGSLKKGGVFVHDKDGDGILDDKTQYVGSTPSASEEFVRRNTLSTNYNYAWKIASSGATLDCNSNSAYVNRYVPGIQMVTDADNDGYKTAAAASTQCVGAQTTINTRVYYKDTSNVSSWLPDGQKLSSNTDCNDSSGAPCAPTINSFTSVGQTSQIFNYAAGVNGPAPTSYDVYDCGTDPGCASPSITNTASTSYTDSSLTCNNVYYYQVLAKNGVGSGPLTTTASNSTASCGGTPTVTTSAPTSKATTSVMMNSTVNPNNATTSITYRYGTSNVTCSSLPSTLAGPTGLTGGSPLSGATTQQSLTGLTAGTRYYFCATANNSFGTTYGSVSNFWTVTNAPTISSATSQTPINSNVITRSGSVTGASSYNLYYCTGGGCTPATTLVGAVGSPYTHSGLTCGTVYRYQLTAVNADGDESAKSSIVGATTTAAGSAATCYPDIDDDNYTLTTKSICTSGGVCGNTTGYQATAGSGTDCYDANSSALPTQTSYFTSARGVAADLDGNTGSSFDYNCNGAENALNVNTQCASFEHPNLVSSGGLCSCNSAGANENYCLKPLSTASCGVDFYTDRNPGFGDGTRYWNGLNSCAPSCNATYQHDYAELALTLDPVATGDYITQSCR